MVKKKLLLFIFLELIIISFSAGATYWYFGIRRSGSLVNENMMVAIPSALPTVTATPEATPEAIPMPTQTPEPTATPSARPQAETSYKTVIATKFWVGEKSDASNDFIPNDKSAWDGNWQENFGGVDDPEDRCGYKPCSFTPKENPFYFALPYNDLDKEGRRKTSASRIPWFNAYSDQKSVLKNHWVEITRGEKRCFAQWQDVGPLETDDFEYVFGNSQPKNQFGAKAGIDLSPAVFDCLGMSSNEEVGWRFVDDNEVPPGPWREIVTNSPVQW